MIKSYQLMIGSPYTRNVFIFIVTKWMEKSEIYKILKIKWKSFLPTCII